MSKPGSKITTGPNDRPRDETIAQSGAGLPDDSGKPVEVDDKAVERAGESLKETPRERLLKEVEEGIDASRKGSE